jgi:hypothetical protein
MISQQHTPQSQNPYLRASNAFMLKVWQPFAVQAAMQTHWAAEHPAGADISHANYPTGLVVPVTTL